VIDKIISYLKLGWLCFRLSFSIFFFGINILLIRIQQKKTWPIFLAIIISFIWIINLYILTKKNTPQIEIIKPQFLEDFGEINISKTNALLTKDQLKTKLETYKTIEESGIKNLSLYLNLSQLHIILDDNQLAQDYLNKAKEINPQIND
jgi:hypothetical protein